MFLNLMGLEKFKFHLQSVYYLLKYNNLTGGVIREKRNKKIKNYREPLGFISLAGILIMVIIGGVSASDQ